MDRWIIFSGGNGRGAYQAGFLQSAMNHGLTFDRAAGVSVGAINAAGVAVGAIPELIELWKTIREDQIIKKQSLLSFLLKVLAGRLPFTKRITGQNDTSRLRDTLRNFLNGRELIMPLYAGRLDIMRAMYVDVVGNSNLVDAVFRSGLIPVKMRADVSGASIWVDGGVENVTPLKRVVDSGKSGDEVWIVLNMNRSTRPKPIEGNASKIDAIDILTGTIDYLVDRQFTNDVRTFLDRNELSRRSGSNPEFKWFSTHVIEPSESLGAGDDYSRAALDRRFMIGKNDADSYFDEAQIFD